MARASSLSRTRSGSRTATTRRNPVVGRSVPASATTPSAGSPNANPVAPAIASGQSVTSAVISDTQARVTAPMDQVCQLWVEYGLTTAYGSETTHETSFNYSTHVQTISGLSASTLYHFRIKAVSVGGLTFTSGDYSFTTSAAAGGGISYTDYSLVGITADSHGHVIDATGAVDSTVGLNHWIAAQPNGSNATTRARYIFPPTATYKITTALCLGNKSYVTVWGHAATSSAWLPGTATSFTDRGCTISFGTTVGSNVRSAFMVGNTFTSDGVVAYAQTCTDVAIFGFNLNGNATTPGIYNAASETVNAFEVGRVVGCEIAYNKAINIPGDFVRTRGDASVCDTVNIHHNWGVAMGRQAISVVEGDTIYFDDNVMDRCGYYGIDLEPDDDNDQPGGPYTYRTIDNFAARRNTFGSFGSSGVAGTFCAIGNGTHYHIADVTITDNVVTGSTYGTYATGLQCQSLRTYIGQHISATTPGADPRIQRLTFSRNVAQSGTQASPVVLAGGVDTFVCQGNDSNLVSGAFLNSNAYLTACTSVTESGNA